MKENSFFHSDFKVAVVVAALASLERFNFLLLGLVDPDDSAIFKFCFEYFSKDSYMSKYVVSKNKANYIKPCFVYTKIKISRNY